MRRHVAPTLVTIVLCIFTLPILIAPSSAKAPKSAQTPAPPPHSRKPIAPQGAEGGIWRTDNSFQSIFMLKNVLEIAPIQVSPVLYMADGTEYDLPPVNLDTAGVAMLNINDALRNAPANVQAHISTYGSAAIQFQWSWAGGVFAAVRTTDETRGLLYQTHLQADVVKTHDATAASSPQVLEGLWWKHDLDPDIRGFLTLTNTSLKSVPVRIETFDSGRADVDARTVVLPSHNTQMIDLSSIWDQIPGGPSTGGLRITYSGPKDAIVAEGGLEDAGKGYSHMLHFEDQLMTQSGSGSQSAQPSGASSTQPQPFSFDSAGIMMGAQDPDMHFPAGTIFTPYMILGNTSEHPLVVQLAANTMTSSGSTDASLGIVTLAPHEVQQVPMKSLLQSAGLGKFNGYLNLRTSFVGNLNDLLEESGGIDQTLNYVFEVPPHIERQTMSRILNYWNTSGDTDTMMTLWNYSDKDEDLIVTFFHQQGKYRMPVHLAAHSSMTMSVGKLIHSGKSDPDGNTFPGNIVQGSMKISGVNGDSDRIDVTVSAGIFNSRTATCSYPCGPCSGVQELLLSPGAFQINLGNSLGVVAWATYTNGNSINVTNDVGWSSSNTTVASVGNTGTTTALAIGASTISGVYGNVPAPGGYSCQGVSGCTPEDISGDAPMTANPTISGITPAQWLVGATLPVTIDGTGFGTATNTTVTTGPGITPASPFISIDSTHITLAFNISPGASGGFVYVYVSVTGSDNQLYTSNNVYFFVQVPTDFVPTYPNEPWPTTNSGHSITIYNANGSVPSGGTGVCGAYWDVYYILVDQTGNQITNGTVTAAESFSNISSSPFHPPVAGSPNVLNLSTGIEGDTQAYWNSIPPNCLPPNGTETFDQYWKVYLGNGIGGTSFNMAHHDHWTWTTNGSGIPAFTRIIQ